MVYMSGGKAARNAASIVNRQNVCGGDKKAGIPSRIGYNRLSVGRNGCNSRAPTCMPTKCVVFKITQTQHYGYRATIGGV